MNDEDRLEQGVNKPVEIILRPFLKIHRARERESKREKESDRERR